MSKPLVAAAAAGLVLLAGCASRPAATATASAATVTVNLATSLVTAQGTWAVTDMGGSAADEENFWQLFVRPAGASKWSLVTPPGVADNGGLVAAGSAGSLLVGFRASQGLAFSPLATSTDAGKNWAAGLLGSGAALAGQPDALSIGPAGQELALLKNGTVEAGTGGGSWSELTSLKALAASPGGRNCGLLTINAMSFGHNGTPVAAGTCARPGVAGVFSKTNGTWQADGPALPTRFGGDQVRVLRLAGTATGNVALLQAGADLLAAWSTGTRWTALTVLPGAAGVRASGFGPDGSLWVLLNDGRGEVVNTAGGAWQALPAVPARTAVLAAGSSGYDALAVSGSTLTVWRLTTGSWAKAQVISVPIVPGSSS